VADSGNRVWLGTTAASLAHHAEQHDIDLIVRGTPGHLAYEVLGSVAECVVRTAKCPVLTVRESGAAKLRNPDSEHTGAMVTAHT
jgi:nucleotide-binding universal stress UspA family protein